MTDDDFMSAPATQVELDLRDIDGALSHLREVIGRDPYIAGMYREDFAEIAAEFHQLAQH